MCGRGVISGGFPAKVFIDHFAAIDFDGGDFHLATADGDVIVETRLPNIQIIVNNHPVSVQSLEADGYQGFMCMCVGEIRNLSCEDQGSEVQILLLRH